MVLETAGGQQEKRTTLPLTTNSRRDPRGGQVWQDADRVDMKQLLVEHPPITTMLHRTESDVIAGSTDKRLFMRLDVFTSRRHITRGGKTRGR